MAEWDIPIDLDGILSEWASEIVGDVEDGVREAAPVSSRSSGEHFADSISASSSGSGVNVESSIIGKFLVEGTPAHPIDSKGKYSLHNPDTGEYFGRHVEHPGTGPHDFLERAIDAIGPEVSDNLSEKIGGQWES